METKTNWVLELVDHISGPAKDIVRWSGKIADGFQHAYDESLKLNMVADSFQDLSNSLSFTNEIAELSTTISQFVEGSASEIDKLTSKTAILGEVWNEPATDIAKAANAMTKNIGGSFESNLAIIEKGFKRGANLNNDFLDQLKEYPATVKMTASEMVGTIVHANKQGIFSDKAIDSIKEATLSLLEMDKAQQDALKGIGIKPEDLLPKINSGNIMGAIKDISAAMNQTGLTAAKQQKIVADIFKGAGEDAGGVTWIKSLAKIETDIDKIVVKETEWQRSQRELKTMMAEAKMVIFDTTKEYMPLIQGLGTVAFVTANLIPAMGALGTMTSWVAGRFKWLFVGAEGNASAIRRLTLWVGRHTLSLWNNGKAVAFSAGRMIWAGATAIAGYVSSLVTTTAAQWGLNIAMSANPIGVIVAGIVLLGAAIYGLIAYWDTVKEYLLDFAQISLYLNPIYWIVKAFEWLFPETYAKITGFFGSLADWITKWVAKIWGAISGVLETIKSVLGFGDNKTIKVEKTTKAKIEAPAAYVSDLKLHSPEELLKKSSNKTTDKKTSASGANVGGVSAQARSVNMTLNITMQPVINSEFDMQKLKRALTDLIVDAGRDSGLTLANG